MSKEELKKEADESAKKFFGKPTDLVDLDNLRIFKNGYLASAGPREKRIEVLEKEVKQLRESNSYMFDTIALKSQQIEKLEKENAELDSQKNRNKSCYSCANATERCFRNEIGCPCEKYKSYKDENAELKAKNKWYSEQVCNKECAEVWGNLTKAKELLNEFMRISKASDEDFEHDYSELIGETEKFLEKVK